MNASRCGGSARLFVLFALSLTGLGMAPNPAPAAVVDAAANGFTVEMSIRTRADPERSWRALTREVGHWWLSEHTWWGRADRLRIEARAGGCFCERSGARQAEHLRVTLVEPPKLLRMQGGLGPLQGLGFSGVLEFRLHALAGGGTEISLRYRVGGYSDQDPQRLAPAVDGVLSSQLQALAEYLNHS